MYFYSDTAPRTSCNINVWSMNANKAYLKHFDNFLFLDFVAKKGTLQERMSVEKEMIICQRKLKFWSRHPNYDDKLVQKEKEVRIKIWRESK